MGEVNSPLFPASNKPRSYAVTPGIPFANIPRNKICGSDDIGSGDMEMNAPGGGKAATIAQPKNQNKDRRNASELDVWLEKAEAMGELKRITAEVNPDLEAAHITYLVGLTKSPALLFENIKGHPGHRALYNMIGCNLSRFCLMIGEEPVDHPLKAVKLLQTKFGRKMKPVEVPASQAVSSQNIVEGDNIDI